MNEGKWIYGENEYGQDGWTCSECEFFEPWDYKDDINFIEAYRFCPHCGSRMTSYTGETPDSSEEFRFQLQFLTESYEKEIDRLNELITEYEHLVQNQKLMIEVMKARSEVK